MLSLCDETKSFTYCDLTDIETFFDQFFWSTISQKFEKITYDKQTSQNQDVTPCILCWHYMLQWAVTASLKKKTETINNLFRGKYNYHNFRHSTRSKIKIKLLTQTPRTNVLILFNKSDMITLTNIFFILRNSQWAVIILAFPHPT